MAQLLSPLLIRKIAETAESIGSSIGPSCKASRSSKAVCYVAVVACSFGDSKVVAVAVVVICAVVVELVEHLLLLLLLNITVTVIILLEIVKEQWWC